MAAREERAYLRKQIASSNKPSISLCLNVPGFPKSNHIVQKFFGICIRELKLFLKANLVSFHDEEAIEQTDAAGDFFIIPFSASNASISDMKMVCENFEEKHSLGRFIDVDFTDSAGNSVSSGKSKLCFFCLQRPAIECRRENTHDLNELRSFMFSKMEAHCRIQHEKEISRQLASLALKAILTEISLTPKPGLVDKSSNGSHADMNYQTFLNSSATIASWFTDLVHAGFDFKEDDLTRALPVVRNIGLQMETAMYAVTHNVNTQKGLIFIMGISLFACGYLFARQEIFEIKRFKTIIKELCKGISSRELEILKLSDITHGEKVYGRYKVTGIRGEAEMGFPTVFDFGFPTLNRYKKLNDEVLIKAFLSIAAHNNDTNILYRSNMDVLEGFKLLASAAFKNFTPKNYEKLMDYCRNENISPGGSADLFALSIFINDAVNLGEIQVNY